MKRLLALLMAITLLAGIVGGAALAADNGLIIVSLRIEGPDKCLYYNERCEFYTAGSASSVADFVKTIKTEKSFPSVTIDEREDGAYISDIGGITASSYGETSGWNFMLNGKLPESSISSVALNNGDELVIFFADLDGAGMIFPSVDSSRLLTDGILRFTSGGTPIVGATVEYDKAPVITDKNGEIVVPQYNMLAGIHYLQIEQYDEATGAPLVMRYPPDYMMFVPFTDMMSGAWYSKAIEYCVVKRFLNGVGDNRFAPDDKMTMVQLITLLWRIAGEDTSLAPGAIWYEAALAWAEASGIIPDIRYDLNDRVTREIFIYMFYKTAALDGKTDMSKRAKISTAEDYGEISEQYADAIRWAVATRLVIGVGGDDTGLTIDPKGLVSRAVACQMLMRYYAPPAA